MRTIDPKELSELPNDTLLAEPGADIVKVIERALEIANERWTKHRFGADATRENRAPTRTRARDPKGTVAHATARPEITPILPTKPAPAVRHHATAKTSPPKARRSGAPSPATAPAPRSRYIPAAVRSLVWQRDHGRRTYIDPQSGRRCDERRYIESRIAQGRRAAHP